MDWSYQAMQMPSKIRYWMEDRGKDRRERKKRKKK
jgi:hypothetical protein